MSTSQETALKRKKRRLSSKKTTESVEPVKPLVKKKRSLKPVSVPTTTTASPIFSRSPSPSQPAVPNSIINATPPPTTAKRSIRAASAAITKREKNKEEDPTESSSQPKRSILAASEAISKRESERKQSDELQSSVSSPTPDVSTPVQVNEVEKKKPAIKRRRKLNTHKIVVVPNSESPADDIELEGAPVNSYSQYLDPKEVQTPANITPITIGVSKRKRKMIPRKSPVSIKKDNYKTTPKSPENTNSIPMEEELDLSQHVILPNSSYIAHLRTRRTSIDTSSSMNYYSDQSVSDNNSSMSEFFDAASEFDQDIVMSSLGSDSTTEFMDFDMNSSSPPTQEDQTSEEQTPEEQIPEESNSFWRSVLTFTRFASN